VAMTTAIRPRPASKRYAVLHGDVLFDVVVLLSVLLFLALAAGVGILALQSALHESLLR
jgi:hypothetical protein